MWLRAEQVLNNDRNRQPAKETQKMQTVMLLLKAITHARSSRRYKNKKLDFKVSAKQRKRVFFLPLLNYFGVKPSDLRN